MVSSYEKVLDESMSSWRPRTTATGGLPNISFIMRKPEPLGTELKTVCCAKTGVMTYMEIMRGAKGMKDMPLQKELGGTAACTVRISMGSKQPCSHKDLIMGDAWFGSVRCASVMSSKNFAGIFQVKSNSGLYPKAFIEEHLKNAPGGVHIVLKGTDPNGVTLIATGYRYSSRKTIHFISTLNAASTTPGTCYEMKFCDEVGNVHTRFVDRPQVVSRFFDNANAVDRHNQVRQFGIKLEKKWVTDNPYFRLFTTLVGIAVTDTWKLASFHKLLTRHNATELPITLFSGILSKQLLQYANKIDMMEKMRVNVTHGVNPKDMLSEMSGSAYTSESNVTQSKKRKFEHWVSDEPEKVYYDKNNLEHALCKFVKTRGAKGKIYRKARVCGEPGCTGQTVYFCANCGPRCNSDKGCFLNHIAAIDRKRTRSAFQK